MISDLIKIRLKDVSCFLVHQMSVSHLFATLLVQGGTGRITNGVGMRYAAKESAGTR